MTVFDANGGVINSLTETRTMDPSGCACGVLFYGWKNGRLHRTNRAARIAAARWTKASTSGSLR